VSYGQPLRSAHYLKLMLDFEKIIARVVQQSSLRLVAIDGLPLAGKSTLADRLALALRDSYETHWCVLWVAATTQRGHERPFSDSPRVPGGMSQQCEAAVAASSRLG
jgi:nicotinamide riboside kinase